MLFEFYQHREKQTQFFRNKNTTEKLFDHFLDNEIKV